MDVKTSDDSSVPLSTSSPFMFVVYEKNDKNSEEIENKNYKTKVVKEPTIVGRIKVLKTISTKTVKTN